MLNQHLKSLLHKPVTRKEFLRIGALGVISIFGIGGVVTELLSHAQTPYTDGQAETGTLAGTTATIADSSASGGSAVQFGTAPGGGGGTTPPNPTDISIVFPADAGHIDVTLHGADKTGKTDCTAIIQGLINANLGLGNYKPAVIYFPAGTYLISNTLYASTPNVGGVPSPSGGSFCDYLTFRGENQATTTIKMQDDVWTTQSATSVGSNGYIANSAFVKSAYPNTECAMLYFSTYGNTQGNNAICNFCFDLTFDLGNNPGGGAVSFLANNIAAVRRCTFKCTAGFLALECGRGQTGPCSITDCTWEGPWVMPMTTNGGEYSIMMERCYIPTHSPGGYSVYANIIMGIKDCTFIDPVQVISGADVSFWYSDGWTGTPVTSHEFGGNSRVQTLAPGVNGFKLHSVDTPLLNYDPITDWANVNDYSSPQAALNSGKSTIYWPIPTGTNNQPGGLPQGLTIPATVTRIMFMGFGPTLDYGNTATPFFTTTGTSSSPLIFDSCSNQNGTGMDNVAGTTDQNTYTFIKHQANRDLVMLDWSGCGRVIGTGVGRIFFDDCDLPCSIGVGDKFYARQWNWEDPYVTGLINSGGEAWIMGPKTEFGCQAPQAGQTYNPNQDNWSSFPCENFKPTLACTNGGRTDVFAGFALPNSGVPTNYFEYTYSNTSFAISYANVQTVAIYWGSNNGLSASPAVTSATVVQPNNYTFYCAASYSYNGG